MKKNLFLLVLTFNMLLVQASNGAPSAALAQEVKASLVIPIFNPIAPICQGASLEPLPTTSLDGIVGTWSPELNNTETTTYTFTPNNLQEATPVTLTIEVFPNANPQPFCDFSNGYLIIDWSPVPGATSYAYSYTINGGAVQSGTTSISNVPVFSVQSNAAVLVTLTNIVGVPCFQPITIACGDLDTTRFEPLAFDFSPNPVANQLKVTCAKPITALEVYNELGQNLYRSNYNENEVTLDMSTFTSGIYLVKAHTEHASKSFKVIKN